MTITDWRILAVLLGFVLLLVIGLVLVLTGNVSALVDLARAARSVQP